MAKYRIQLKDYDCTPLKRKYIYLIWTPPMWMPEAWQYAAAVNAGLQVLTHALRQTEDEVRHRLGEVKEIG